MAYCVGLSRCSIVMSSFLPQYAELHCITNFSFLRGASHPEELVSRAREIGYEALALTDECSLAGAVRAHVEAKRVGLHLILGTEVTLSCGMKLVVLAMDLDGYRNMSEWITLGRRRSEKGSYELHRGDVTAAPVHMDKATRHLSGLPGCLVLFIPDRSKSNEEITEQVEWTSTTFPERAWIGVESLLQADDRYWTDRVFEISHKCQVPVLATGDVHMHVRSRKPLQDTLTAIRLGRPLSECGLELRSNAEQHLRQIVRLASIYPRSLLDETVAIAERCTFSLDELQHQYPQEIAPAGETLPSYLRRLTYEGAAGRYPQGIPAKVQNQIEYELEIIKALKFEAYFLTVHMIVQFAKREGILHQGRGSAGNSVISFCLGLSAVDPERMQDLLVFERFLSLTRPDPPDLDLDFEHQRRSEVINFIYETFGRHRAGLTAAVTTYRPRSAMKDVGKALGMDFDQLNRLTSSHQWWDGSKINVERLREAGLDPDSRIVKHLTELSQTLVGFPRHLSQHVGGFVITQDSLSRVVPIENAAMADRSVIQWDKDDIEAMGMVKVDILALGMLTAIRRALDMISERRGAPFTMHDVPAEDPATYDAICAADSIGTFQIESKAQLVTAARLRPRKFFDLVIQVALIRPGPIQGGFVTPFLRRREGLEEVVYASEDVRAVLEPTLGVPIFQEQVMKLAMVAGGFTGAEADHLRRAMGSWKRKGGLEQQQQKLIAGMLKNGYTEEFATSVAAATANFASYGFPLPHAASFAHITYVSAWIKTHEPAAFLAALLNSQPMGFYGPMQLIQDAKRHGVEVLAPDVTISDWDCTLKESGASAADRAKQPAVRLGLRVINGLSTEGAERITFTRAVHPYQSVDDLVRRARVTTQDLQALAKANALEALAGHRRQAAWEAAGMRPVPTLLRDAPIQEKQFEISRATEGQEIVADYASMNMTLNGHPLALLRDRFNAMNLSTAAEMRQFPDRKLARTTGLVTMRQRPETAKGTMFVTLEDETGVTNVIIWPALFEKQRVDILNASLLTVYGKWQRHGDVMHLVALRVVNHTEMLGDLSVDSRNFH
jgi:error-prone DNA polymerase